MPWNDWQFWVVCATALLAAGVVLRPLLPARRARPACPGCPGDREPAGKKTVLTIEGEPARHGRNPGG
ncbi:MAG: hypothetical protein EBQ99_01255 [Planctomycetes bacterium]|nr:hypothetical protein [Planctomycetota bacterium]